MKAKKAALGKKDKQLVYDELTSSIDQKLINRWRDEEAEAMRNRGEKLKIFQVHEDNGRTGLQPWMQVRH
jgi:hypothetical protein